MRMSVVALSAASDTHSYVIWQRTTHRIWNNGVLSLYVRLMQVDDRVRGSHGFYIHFYKSLPCMFQILMHWNIPAHDQIIRPIHLDSLQLFSYILRLTCTPKCAKREWWISTKFNLCTYSPQPHSVIHHYHLTNCPNWFPFAVSYYNYAN